MLSVSDTEFEKIVNQAMDSLPAIHRDNLKNIAFVIEPEPSARQRRDLHLEPGQTLLGLFEGTPTTGRGGIFSIEMPDKITIFQKPLLACCNSKEELIAATKNTVWHEVAHYFGLDHEHIHGIEHKYKNPLG